jgi:hypothetical protein
MLQGYRRAVAATAVHEAARNFIINELLPFEIGNFGA